MTKTIYRIMRTGVVFSAVFVLFSCTVMPITDVAVSSVEPIRVLYIRAENVGMTAMFPMVRRMNDYFSLHEIPAENVRVLIVYANRQNNKYTLEVAFAVTNEIAADPEGKIKEKTYPALQQAAVIIHTGPYSGLRHAAQQLSAWIEQNGYQEAGPLFEEYLNNPKETPIKELKTKIWIPVELKTEGTEVFAAAED